MLGGSIAQRAHPLQAVGKGKADALDQGADQMAPVVREAEPDPGAARVRVHVRRALAGEIGQEQQPVGAGRHRGGTVHQRGERVQPLAAMQIGLGRNDLVAEPAERAAGGEDHAHQVVAAGHRSRRRR